MSKHVRFFTLNDPHQMRISPELATEIGLNNSIFLLQLEYLIGISSTEEHEDDLWTYQSLEKLKSNFPWWSITTISRIAKELESMGLIKIGNFNKLGFDRTQWFAINWENCRKLKSIVIQDAIFQNEKSKRSKCKMDSAKMKNPSRQNETTIPEIPTEIPTEESNSKNDSFGNPILSESDAEEIYRRVTNHICIPSKNRDEVIRLICDIGREKGLETVEYLKPFFAEWKNPSRRTKDGRKFSTTGIGWLDWAVSGDIPALPGHVVDENTRIATNVFQRITGMNSIPSLERDNVVRIILDVYAKKGAETEDFLRKFFTAWCDPRRKTKSGKPYSRTGTGWLDWAAKDCIPEIIEAPVLEADNWDQDVEARKERARKAMGK